MRIVTAFVTLTFTLMFFMYAFEFAKFLKVKIQGLFRLIMGRRKKKNVPVKNESIERDLNSDVEMKEMQLEVVSADDLEKRLKNGEFGDSIYDDYRKVFGDI